MPTFIPYSSELGFSIGAAVHGRTPCRTITVVGEHPGLTSAAITASGSATLWTGPTHTYPWLDSSQALELVSTSEQDAPGGTGADLMRIRVLDAAGVESELLVAPNGTTPVSLGTYYRVNLLEVAHSGSGRRNAGGLRVRTVSGGTVLSNLAAGVSGPAKQFIYTVPAGYWLHVGTYYMTLFCSNGQVPDSDTAHVAQLVQFGGPDAVGGSNTWSELISFGINQNMGSTSLVPRPSPQAWPPLTDLEIRVQGVTATGTVRPGVSLNFSLVPADTVMTYPGGYSRSWAHPTPG